MYPILFISSQPQALESYIAANGYSDYHRYDITPIKTTLSMDQIRDLKKQLSIKPAKKRLIVLHQLDNAGIETQNALLKTFEESTQDNQFIMPVAQLNSILPTIQSRCQVVRSDESTEQVITEADLDQLFKSLREPNYAVMNLPLLQLTSIDEAVILLQAITVYLEEKINNGDLYIAQLSKKTLQILALVRNNNLNPQLAIDNWLIFAKRTALQMK
ncbi:MAG: hypothetical protein ACEQSA_01765 [Weeksellaceae bacterium]